jgi:hypothetical protein
MRRIAETGFHSDRQVCPRWLPVLLEQLHRVIKPSVEQASGKCGFACRQQPVQCSERNSRSCAINKGVNSKSDERLEISWAASAAGTLIVRALDIEDFERMHRTDLSRLPHVFRIQPNFALREIIDSAPPGDLRKAGPPSTEANQQIG